MSSKVVWRYKPDKSSSPPLHHLNIPLIELVSTAQKARSIALYCFERD